MKNAVLLLLVWDLSLIAGYAAIPGHVEAWGYNRFGQATPPSGLDGVVAIAAGGQHSLALLSNGTVVAWGDNSTGQSTVPLGLTNVTAIAAALHNVALKRDGTVAVWGNTAPEITNVPSNLNGIMAIEAGNIAGNGYTLALRSNGTVAAWGLMPFVTNLPPGLTNIIRLAAGSSHALALKKDGSVIGWGENNAGQAVPPPGLAGIVGVAAGQQSSLAIKSDGTVVKWGSFPNPPLNLDGVLDAKLGANHALALRSNGLVVAWGDNSIGQGVVPADLNGVTAISAGGSHNLVVTARPIVQFISPPVTVNIGDTVTFSVTATGSPLSYQWQHNAADILHATNQMLVLMNVKATNSGTYVVRVLNPHGNTLSPPTSLSFPPPVIAAPPESLTRYRGENASFQVTASGVTPLTYGWLKDGASLPAATAPNLTLTDLRSTNAGNYQAVVTDAAGASVTSVVATLTIIDPSFTNSLVLTPIADTSIFTSGVEPQGTASILAGTRNNGINDRGLLRFNLSALDRTAVIRSANLRLTVIRVPRRPANSNFSLYRLFKTWGNDATWAIATVGVPWTAPGGAAGVDYNSSSSATQFVTGGAAYDFASPGMASDVQDSLRNPGTNQGWLLKTENEGTLGTARHFGSSESMQPPQLMLQYTIPAPPAQLNNVVANAGNFTFRFNASPGWLYRVECRENVDTGPWTTVTNMAAGAATNPIVIYLPLNAPHRFYRVVAE